ncbi:MAG: DUF2203 family protein [Bdellovibrionales bacterium]|nr:DUF2203 family protein [Bdellovibrionales bacterium]
MSIVEIHKKDHFDLKSAQQLLPVLKNITKKYSEKVDALIEELEKIDHHKIEVTEKIEEDVNTEIREWHKKMKSLGVIPKGLWIIDFDFGRGYFCWQYPEEDILYWHGYNEGYSSREKINDYKLLSPPTKKVGKNEFLFEV